ncbi:MAG: hypothetical protein ABJH05_05690 [Fulvivirga sp.]
MFKNYQLSEKYFIPIEISIALIFCVLPLFITFPYKINLYLAWEGAYRMSLGQVPFRDFGMPLGYGYWLLPALFFKIFGPFMSTLTLAQVCINLVSVFALHKIFQAFRVKGGIRVIGIFLFCLSYVFVNFWPWYNHTVFVYELIGLAFLLHAILDKNHYSNLKLITGALFIFLSFFTKQDIGGLAFVFALSLLTIDAICDRSYKSLLIFTASFLIIGALFILPLTFYDFGYWFNYGQPPHGTRISILDLLGTIFSESALIMRFYIIAMIIYCVHQWHKNDKLIAWPKREILFFFFTLGMVVQPLIAQQTTYIPENVHYYYHSFVVVFLLSQLKLPVDRPIILGGLIICILLFWTQDYWRYANRIMKRVFNVEQKLDYNYVSKHTWKLKDENGPDTDRSDWVKTPFKSLDNVLMPKETVQGMQNLVNKYAYVENLKVLNMSELTQLAYEIGYIPEKGPKTALWYHRNVAFFQREVDATCDEIRAEAYDLVLFEVIPRINRFYPPDVRACLQEHYKLVKRFKAPRIPEDSFIEVYERPAK